MAIVHEVNLSLVAKETNERIVRELLGAIFWSWFWANRDRKLTTVKWWVLRKTFTVRDLEHVFVLLFGPSPQMLGVPAP
jgi:hypothetical protein